jgi:formylglycine-generating enzyme required for sulfatase activity
MIVRRLNQQLLSTAALLAVSLSAATAQAEVSFTWATVGNAGNAADTPGYGAVSYEYRIATTEVTNAQYAEFLNAVAATDAYDLYNTSMAGNYGGITRTGSSGSYTYSVNAGRANNPVTYVSWYDAARFSNWLHNGQGSGSTETGAYTLLGGTPMPSNGLSVTRNAEAQYNLPSEDEWYKAAYHDASAGTAGTYFTYATGSNDVPVSDQPGSASGESLYGVNYFNDDGLANEINDGYAVWDGTHTDNPFTNVGAYTDAGSPYGTFDQNGNMWEWNEAVISTSQRGLRGGAWDGGEGVLSSAVRGNGGPTGENPTTGFRVASLVPEPGSLALLTVVVPLILRRRRG